MQALGGAAALAVVMLAGCATTQPPSSVPTNIKNGQSWIVTRRSVAEQVLNTCSRESPARHPDQTTSYWTPSRQQIEQLESRQDALTPAIPEPRDFDRQYVGVVIQGQQLIYINAFKLPNDPPVKPARKAIQVCGGGSTFWGALYDPQTGAFSHIAVNGTP
ncbi:hypothetical protein [Xanthomonas fragariae]|uniref:hypothetical protein n=1 Tax=Xanthomonas fragariae TaxID=48664 RepID=UPI001ABEAB8C|nr:hypothetical protein [Xanthomonas fragariae]UKR53673.1 hypothetical protein K4A87_07325 [Xanthomonas fragariae]